VTVLRACLDCGAPSPWSRCALHRKAKQRVRTRNRRTARAVIAASPVCADCGATRDLTSDHVVPLAQGGSNAGRQRTLCRPCNSRRGGRLAGGDGGRGRQ
jgi:5-methylcytosine-specific restriction endonuclease McrA